METRIEDMQTNIIYSKSSELMGEVPDESVDLIVTSPPYNIDIKYGNKTEKGKITASKAVKYSDKMEESKYREFLRSVFDECKRVLKKDGLTSKIVIAMEKLLLHFGSKSIFLIVH